MPYHRAKAKLDVGLRQQLIEELARELAGSPSPIDQTTNKPVIFEEEISHTGTFHVIVVWEK